MSTDLSVDGVLRVQQIIFAALVCAVVSFAIVVIVVAKGEPEPLEPAIRWAISGAALVVTTVALWLRATRLPKLGEELSPYNRQTRPEEVPPKVANRMNIAYILCWALAEAVAVYGLVLAFISHDAKYFWPFGFASLLLLLTNPPTRGRLESAILKADDEARAE